MDPCFGVAALHLAIPSAVARILQDGPVLALSLALGTHGWMPGVSVCVRGSSGRALWLECASNILALGVAGLPEAALLLQQPHPASRATLRRAWEKGVPSHASLADLRLTLHAAGAWLSAPTTKQAVVATHPPAYPASPGLPAGLLNGLALPAVALMLVPPAQTRHRQMATLAHLPALAHAVLDCLPGSEWRPRLHAARAALTRPAPAWAHAFAA